MDNENKTPVPEQELDSFQREERCIKVIKTVRKAIFMRLFVSVLLIWVVLQTNMDLWIIGLMTLVLLINLMGLLPLVAEWKKQRKERKRILAEED